MLQRRELTARQTSYRKTSCFFAAGGINSSPCWEPGLATRAAHGQAAATRGLPHAFPHGWVTRIVHLKPQPPSYYNNLMDFFLMLLIAFSVSCSHGLSEEARRDSFCFQGPSPSSLQRSGAPHKSPSSEVRRCSYSLCTQLRMGRNVLFFLWPS